VSMSVSVTVRTLNQPVSFKLPASKVGGLAPAVDILLQPGALVPALTLTVQVSAASLDDLLDAIDDNAGRLDDPDRLAAIRLDETAFCAELDVASRPVNPRRLQ
jgi:hypothetical protein